MQTNMVGATRIEINFNRLLRQCQVMAEDKENRDWRLDKYIAALQNFLVDLKKAQSKPPQETLQEYQKKVDLLKGLAEAEKKPTVSERALITDRLRPVSSELSSAPAKQLQFKAKAKSDADMRTELFRSTKSNKENATPENLRQRRKPQEEEDINTILEHHHKLQERLAEEMLLHTKALKQNITEAGKVVKDDTKTISDSMKLADVNSAKLKVEGERLEAHTKTCSWWIWVMLVIVIITFVSMVLFMRIFSK